MSLLACVLIILLLSPSLRTPIPCFQLLNSLSKNPDADCKYGLYFRDGKRKVDYILVYHYKKSSAGRTLARRVHHNDSSARSTKQDQPLPGKGVQLEMGESEPHMDYHEDDKRFRREEYEGNLVEAGLELERDEDVRSLFKRLKIGGGELVVKSWEMLSRSCEPGSDQGYTSSALGEFDFSSGSAILTHQFNSLHRNGL